jgi:hypothetical protein
MSEIVKVPQPRKMETDAVAKCRHCGAEIYKETFLEIDGVPTERFVVGSFRQALDNDGRPFGPVIPFCNCKEK